MSSLSPSVRLSFGKCPYCYLLCGIEKAVLIDTGLGVANIKTVVDSLTTLPVMVITTHVHWDHIGGHRYFDYIVDGNITVVEIVKEINANIN